MNKAALVERIADVVLSRKLPPLLDVKDVSTDDVRIALELKRDADPKMVMAYLFKNTPLQTNVIVNLTCLIPTENAEVGRPERLDLKAILWHFLHFRLEVVTNRLEHELEVAAEADPRARGLREGLRRARRDHQDHPQVGRQGRLGGEDHEAVRARRRADRRHPRAEAVSPGAARDPRHPERACRQAEARAADHGLLKDEDGRWKVVREELEAIQAQYAKSDKRPHDDREPRRRSAFTEDDFIVEEDNVVIVSRDGWLKRQKEVRDLSTTRLREGDSVLAVLQGSTRATVVFFTTSAPPTRARIIDVPASTGYGEPVQKLFKLRDGERVIAALSLDPRVAGTSRRRRKASAPPVHALAATTDGYASASASSRSSSRARAPGGALRGRPTASKWLAWRGSPATRRHRRDPRKRERSSAAPTRSTISPAPARA